MAVRELVVNKSCGIDGIYAEHMLYSSHVLFRLLALCMSSFLVHGFLPDEMMTVALVPIIKSKSGRIMSKDNYRPIALASIFSKVLEQILLNRLYMFLDRGLRAQINLVSKRGIVGLVINVYLF